MEIISKDNSSLHNEMEIKTEVLSHLEEKSKRVNEE